MESILWALLGVVLMFGYCASVVSCMIDASSDDEWWVPFVLGALVPFWWLSDNWRDIVSAIAMVLFFAVVFGVAALLGELVKWVWGML